MQSRIPPDDSTLPPTGKQPHASIADWEAEHGDGIIWKLERRGFTRDDAEDALQEAWGKVVQGAMPRATTPAGIRKWLLQIARHAAIDAIRKRKPEDTTWTESHESAVVSYGVDPFTELCQKEHAELIEAAMGRLSHKHITVICLYRESGKKSDVAKHLGISNSAAGKLVDRAIRQWIYHMKFLDDYGE
jgi:RNA polymerase sigma-70 factor (ECF subfamily)